MKRIICWLLLTIIVLGLVSCDNQSENNANTTSVTTAPPIIDCRNGGKHTYVDGVCTGCQIQVYDIIREYINAHCDSHGNYRCGNNSERTCTWIRCNNGTIVFHMRMNYIFTYDVYLYIDKYSIESAQYQWEGSNNENGIRLSGYIDANTFTPGTHRLDHSSSETGADQMAATYADTIQENFNARITAFLREVGYDITLADLGFTRY